MSLVRSVEEILITIPTSATSNTGTLTKGQIDNKCVPFTTVAAAASTSEVQDTRFVRVTISGSTVTATRSAASSIISVDVIIFVVEFTNECTVQTGEITVTGLTGTDSPPIDFTDLTKTFVYMTFTPNSTSNDVDDTIITVEITNTTTLTFTRQNTSIDITCRWYTVECDDVQFDVQRGSFLLDGTNNTAQSAAFTAVDMARTMVIGNFNSDEISSSGDTGNCTIDLFSTTTVRARRANGAAPPAGEIDVDFQVIQFAVAENITVQRGEFSITVTEDTDTITAVDLNRSMAHSPAGENNSSIDAGGSGSISQFFAKMDLQDSTTVRGRVVSDGLNSINSWEVVEWELQVIIPIIETFTVANTSPVTTLDVNAPAGLVQNDMIIIVVSLDGDAANPQSTGFTQFGQTSQGTTELYYLIKRATASEPATYTVTWTGSEAGRFTVLRISGVLQSGAAIDTVDITGAGATGDATTANVPAITSTEIDTLAICAVSVDGNVVDAADGFSDALGFVVEGTPGSGGGGGAGQIIGSKGIQAIESSLSPTFGTWTAQGFGTRMFNLKPVSAVVAERVFSTAITNISAII